MEDKEKLEGQQRGRREFLSCLGSALACSVAAAAASAVTAGTVAAAAEPAVPEVPPNPAIPGYDWTHQWHSGSMPANASLLALRQACKKENNVPLTRITSAPGSNDT